MVDFFPNQDPSNYSYTELLRMSIMYVYLYIITYIYLSLHYIYSHFVDLDTHNFIDVPGQRKLDLQP